MASCKGDALKRYQSRIESLPTDLPIVFLDGGDSPVLGGDLNPELQADFKAGLLRRSELIFKREYLEGRIYPAKVYPMPFSFNFNYAVLPPQSLTCDVAFWAVESLQSDQRPWIY